MVGIIVASTGQPPVVGGFWLGAQQSAVESVGFGDGPFVDAFLSILLPADIFCFHGIFFTGISRE